MKKTPLILFSAFLRTITFPRIGIIATDTEAFMDIRAGYHGNPIETNSSIIPLDQGALILFSIEQTHKWPMRKT